MMYANFSSPSRPALMGRFAIFLGLLTTVAPTRAHEKSLQASKNRRLAATAIAAAQAEDPRQIPRDRATCRLTIALIDPQSGEAVHGLVRITDLASGKAIRLGQLIEREMNWYAAEPNSTVTVPRDKLRIEAFYGIETDKATHELDLTATPQEAVRLPLTRIYDPAANDLWAGNTHLHLMRMSFEEADRYLRVVPRADGLDLVFVSYLRRLPDEKTYISNELNSGILRQMSRDGVVFSNGEEHRHNFSRHGEGYGHVMLLDIPRLIRPVSIGPGIMRRGTDGIPLQRGIRQAQRDGATVIWCHNTYGMEDIPNWTAGLVDAQNIFDGSPHGSYSDSFYRYLNLGMNVPFSTGTDWFVYDFSRVYVPRRGPLTSDAWLAQLTAGKSYITNGTFLELSVADHQLGDTIALDAPQSLKVRGHGRGREDFGGLQLIYNGQVVQAAPSESSRKHFRADGHWTVDIDQPGWLALRIPLDAKKNEFGQPLFAHTSPVYIELAGRRIFRPEVAEALIDEIRESIATIVTEGTFANDQEKDAVLSVYRQGIQDLEKRLKQHRQSAKRRGDNTRAEKLNIE